MRLITTISLSHVSALGVAAFMIAFGPVPAFAAEPEVSLPAAGPPMAKVRDSRFTFLDVDGDGYLQRDEVPKDDLVLRSQFSALDRNDDGQLDIQEYVVTRR